MDYCIHFIVQNAVQEKLHIQRYRMLIASQSEIIVFPPPSGFRWNKQNASRQIIFIDLRCSEREISQQEAQFSGSTLSQRYLYKPQHCVSRHQSALTTHSIVTYVSLPTCRAKPCNVSLHFHLRDFHQPRDHLLQTQGEPFTSNDSM